MGYDIGNSVSAVIPVIVGEDLTAYQLARALHAQGIYVSPVTHPAVKKGTARVRVSVMATHTTDSILKALKAFENAKTMVPMLADITSPQKSEETLLIPTPAAA
jgi:glycine C-acetyltransferase